MRCNKTGLTYYNDLFFRISLLSVIDFIKNPMNDLFPLLNSVYLVVLDSDDSSSRQNSQNVIKFVLGCVCDLFAFTLTYLGV